MTDAIANNSNNNYNKYLVLFVDIAKGRIPQMNFGKSAKGEVIFNPKIYVADFGNFKQGFLSMKLIQNSNFRVQCMLFKQLY